MEELFELVFKLYEDNVPEEGKYLFDVITDPESCIVDDTFRQQGLFDLIGLDEDFDENFAKLNSKEQNDFRIMLLQVDQNIPLKHREHKDARLEGILKTDISQVDMPEEVLLPDVRRLQYIFIEARTRSEDKELYSEKIVNLLENADSAQYNLRQLAYAYSFYAQALARNNKFEESNDMRRKEISAFEKLEGHMDESKRLKNLAFAHGFLGMNRNNEEDVRKSIELFENLEDGINETAKRAILMGHYSTLGNICYKNGEEDTDCYLKVVEIYHSDPALSRNIDSVNNWEYAMHRLSKKNPGLKTEHERAKKIQAELKEKYYSQ